MDFTTLNQQALERLDRDPAYFDGLEARLGFPVRDGRAFLVHAAGVSFRKDTLAAAKPHCSFEHSPPAQLEPEPTNEYDPNAVKINIGVQADEITGEWKLAHAGYLPKKRCPACCRSLSGKMAESQICPDCETDIGLGSDLEDFAAVNAWVTQALEQGMDVKIGIDNITEPQHTRGNQGLDVWVRIDEPDTIPA